MCGICGFFVRGGDRLPEDVAGASVQRMTQALSHRGPDDAGVWVDANAGLALGHRRLSILDLSPAGHQPMVSPDGRLVLVMNGEIYNFQELRKDLEQAGYTFRGDSDTEVMLAEFSRLGVPAALQRFVGMFAFALWDRRTRTLVLGRDRLGEKPLYYGWMRGTFLFGSELKALKAFSRWQGELNPEALALLLGHRCIPAPFSVYRNVFKLLPGSYLSLSEGELQSGHTPEPIPYWDLGAVATMAEQDPYTGDTQQATDHLEQLLRVAISGQMVADVPVGAFLSGGIDSSTVVALMQAQSPRPVKTFSIGFDARGYDEARHASAVANHLGTDHTELYVRPQELCDTVPQLSCIYDEPFSDTSQIPTVLLCQLARRQVTVSLSGDGGDELFGGYNHYAKAQAVWRALRPVPRQLRTWVGSGLKHSATRLLASPLSNSSSRAHWLGRACNLSSLLGSGDLQALHDVLRLQCRDADQWLRSPMAPPCRFTDQTPWDVVTEPLRQMMFSDTIAFLPEDILVKVDRSAMAVALETRIPLLDHRVVEFAWRLPISFLLHENQGKWLLRQVLYRYVPRSLVERPKQGFEPPVAQWLRGPLRPWAEELLSEAQLSESGLFQEKNIRQKWAEHLTRKRDWTQPLWSMLMFQAWLAQEKAPTPNPGARHSRIATPVVNA